MPELPEVEAAARELAGATVGKRIVGVRLLHPALRRRVTPAQARSLLGRRVAQVQRRGKHQLVALDDGSVLHVHFRMAGDWAVARDGGADPPHARASFEFDDGTRVTLVDPRALSTISVHPSGGGSILPTLGPDATDPALTPAQLKAALANRRLPVKPALLDQRVVAGVGNIYAAEALWHARVDPRAPAGSLSLAELRRVLDGIRRAIADAIDAPGRYARGEATRRLNVYGREGEPCRRCGTPIERIVQGGRSTYFCPRCQRAL